MPPGWYDDPFEYGWLRYWDGTSWSRHTAPRPASFIPAAPAAQTGQSGSRDASFGERLLAYIIDALLISVPVSSLVLIGWAIFNPTFLAELLRATSGSSPPALSELMAIESGPILISSLVMGPAWFCYEYLLLRRYSATVGMKVLRLRVTSESGAAADARSALLRALVFGAVQLAGIAPIIGPLVSVAFLVDCLSMNWDRNRQTWHDKLAKTRVVKLPAGAAPAGRPRSDPR